LVMTTKHNQPCPACDSLNYGATCTCGELDDQPDVEAPFASEKWSPPVSSVRYTRTGGWSFAQHTDPQNARAKEWQGMDGFKDPKE